jgi:hypothetical protein
LRFYCGVRTVCPGRPAAKSRRQELGARDYAARSRCSTLSTAAGVHCLPRRVTNPWSLSQAATQRSVVQPPSLRGAEAKPAVIQGATARLFAVDAVFPYALRKRLNARRIGNITLRNVDPLAWLAWLQVWRGYVMGGEFLHEKSKALDGLIGRALDAARKDWVNATSVSGGVNAETSELFARYTEAGQAWSATPEREHELQRHVDAYDAEREQREREKEEEFAKLRQALNDYAGKLTLQQQHAWRLIINEPELEGKAIADESGALPPTVSRLRKWFAEMSKRFFELCATLDDNGAPADVAPDTALDTTLDVNEPDALEALGAPDVDVEIPESVLAGYARNQRSSSAFQRPSRRQYSDSALARGYETHRATSEDRVFAELHDFS